LNHKYVGSTEVPPAARKGPEDIREINREQINIRLEHKNSDSPFRIGSITEATRGVALIDCRPFMSALADPWRNTDGRSTDG